MWPAIIAAARAYAPWVVFPFALVVGAIGYSIETAVSDRTTPWRKSASERREERKISGEENPSDFGVPKTIFERNVSPGIQESTRPD